MGIFEDFVFYLTLIWKSIFGDSSKEEELTELSKFGDEEAATYAEETPHRASTGL
jgi:hypothetical protein